jgi:hypothetical protein
MAQVKVELADVRERIMNELVVRRRESAYREFIEGLRKRADVIYAGGNHNGTGATADTLPADTAAADGG